jgi:hypothetical protein
MVRVTKVPGEPEAEAFCDLLRKNGIPCAHRLTPEDDSPFEHISPDGMREILVSPDDLEAAKALLNEE